MADEEAGEMTLAEMFDDSEAEAPAEVEVKTETEAKTDEADQQGEVAEPATEDSSDAAVAEVAQESKPAEPPTAEQKGQLAALIAERDKRQRLEARVKELEGELGEEPQADPITDVKDQVLKDKIELSRDIMLELDSDYEAKYEPYFMSMVVDGEGNVKDEDLLTKFRTATNPAKFARDTAKQAILLDSVQSGDYEAQLRNQIKAELLAELKAEGNGEITAADVPDMTTSADSGSNSMPVIKDEESVSDMSFGIDT